MRAHFIEPHCRSAIQIGLFPSQSIHNTLIVTRDTTPNLTTLYAPRPRLIFINIIIHKHTLPNPRRISHVLEPNKKKVHTQTNAQTRKHAWLCFSLPPSRSCMQIPKPETSLKLVALDPWDGSQPGPTKHSATGRCTRPRPRPRPHVKSTHQPGRSRRNAPRKALDQATTSPARAKHPSEAYPRIGSEKPVVG